MQIVQLSETDVLGLQLGRMILQGLSAASKLDQTTNELSQIQSELKKLKDQLPATPETE